MTDTAGPDASRTADSRTATRDALHRLAEQVLARWRWEQDGHIGLDVSPGGLGTSVVDGPDGPFRVSVEGTDLVVVRGDRTDRHALTTVRAAARVLGVEPSAPPVYPAATSGDPDAPLAVDAAAAADLAGWWWRSRQVLAGLAGRHPERGLGAPTLWPEHFDLAVSATAPGLGADAVVNLGAAAGDDHLAEPYAYVGPWPVPAAWDDPWWNAPFGRSVPAAQLVDGAALAALFEEGLRRTA